jgi:hypothetical protein
LADFWLSEVAIELANGGRFPVVQGGWAATLRLLALAAYVAWGVRHWKKNVPHAAPRAPPGPGMRRVPDSVQYALILAGLAIAFQVAPAMAAAVSAWFPLEAAPWAAATAWLTTVGAFAAWALRFAHSRALEVPSVPLGKPAGPWQDTGLKGALVVIGIFAAVGAVMMAALVRLGVCWNGCTGWRSSLPWLMLLVPLGYAIGAARYVRARARRAERDPQWRARASSKGSITAVVVSTLLLMLFLLVSACFGLVGLASR